MNSEAKRDRSGTESALIRQIRSMRKAAGLTQPEMALRSGVGLRFVRDLERGKPTVRLDKVNQVLQLFGHHIEAVKDQSPS